MDELLAKQILEHGSNLYTYLFIRALYEIHGEGDSVTTTESIDPFELNILQDSGYIKYRKDGDNTIIALQEKGRWLFLPPEVQMPKKKENKKYIPHKLTELANKLGYPMDWVPKTGKYIKNYQRLLKRENAETIEEIAEWVEKEFPQYDLNVFLTESWFNSFKKQKANPKKSAIEDRGSEEYKPYNSEKGY